MNTNHRPRGAPTLAGLMLRLARDQAALKEDRRRFCSSKNLDPVTAEVLQHIEEQRRTYFYAILPKYVYRACRGKSAITSRQLSISSSLLIDASLLLDDFVEKHEHRSGRPSSRIVHGDERAIIAHDALILLAVSATPQGKSCDLRGLLPALAAMVDHDLIRGKSYAAHCLAIEQTTGIPFAVFCRQAAQAAGTSSRIQEAAYAFGLQLGTCLGMWDELREISVETSHPEMTEFSTRDTVVNILLKSAARDLERIPSSGALFQYTLEHAYPTIRNDAQSRARSALAALLVFPSSPARTLLESACRAAIAEIDDFPNRIPASDGQILP